MDYRVLMEKLYRLFHIETLMLGGGGVLNWSFLQAGFCDEVSIVLAPAADGSNDTPALFADVPMSFQLQQAEVLEGSVVWLRYTVQA